MPMVAILWTVLCSVLAWNKFFSLLPFDYLTKTNSFLLPIDSKHANMTSPLIEELYLSA